MFAIINIVNISNILLYKCSHKKTNVGRVKLDPKSSESAKQKDKINTLKKYEYISWRLARPVIDNDNKNGLNAK